MKSIILFCMSILCTTYSCAMEPQESAKNTDILMQKLFAAIVADDHQGQSSASMVWKSIVAA